MAELRIPAGTRLGGGCVGGLSAVDRDPSTGRYLLLSDARRDPFLLVAEIDLVAAQEERPARIDLRVVAVVKLLRGDGSAFPGGSVDPEGLAIAGDGVWISSEGAASAGIPPFVARFGLDDGRQRRSLDLPASYLPRLDAGRLVAGVPNNRAFEGLTLEADGRTLWAGTEGTLVQEQGGPRLSALLRFDLGASPPRVSGDFRYPLRRPPVPGTSIGLVELLALEDGRLLALERSFGALTGVAVGIFEWTPPGGPGDDGKPAAVTKHRWTAIRELGTAPENLEGMTEVPAGEGAVELLLVSDNNDPGCTGSAAGADAPDTQLLWLRAVPRSPSKTAAPD